MATAVEKARDGEMNYDADISLATLCEVDAVVVDTSVRGRRGGSLHLRSTPRDGRCCDQASRCASGGASSGCLCPLPTKSCFPPSAGSQPEVSLALRRALGRGGACRDGVGYERLCATGVAWVHLAMLRLMLRRLARF
jgi:hypothetical protein